MHPRVGRFLQATRTYGRDAGGDTPSSVGIGYLICDRLMDRADLGGRTTNPGEWAPWAALCGGL